MSDAINLACIIARSKTIVDLPETKSGTGQPSKKEIGDFLNKYYIENSKKNNANDTIPTELIFDIGTAIEMAGNRLNALTFYEIVKGTVPENSDLYKQIMQRWIVCKERQAKHTIENENDKSKGELRYREANEEREKYDIKSDAKLPEYLNITDWSSIIKYTINNKNIIQLKTVPEKDINPEIKDGAYINTSEESVNENFELFEKLNDNTPTKIEFALGDYNFKYFSNTNRLNIEHKENGENLSIKITENTATGDWGISNYVCKIDGEFKKIINTPICYKNSSTKLSVWLENLGMGFYFPLRKDFDNAKHQS